MPAGGNIERSLRNLETQRDIDAANTLISPPPEEMLRATRARTAAARYSATPEPSRSEGPSSEALLRTPTTSKRKRLVSSSSQSTSASTDRDQHGKSNPLASVENTPNPKSRKQAKRSYRDGSQAPTTPTKSRKGTKSPSKSPSKRAATQSPSNPLANYLPIPRVERQRRSVTPVVIPYEPPTDEFTPPREVLYTPVAKPPHKTLKSASKRKPASPKKKLVMQIKKEIPDDIDLNAPIPPPSPSDDPLLLRGPPGSKTVRKRTKSKAKDGATQTQDSQSLERSSPIEEYFPHEVITIGSSPDTSLDAGQEAGPTPEPGGPFDFSAEGNDSDWTSDSDQELDHVGTFTGKYKEFTVPTKMDPPSSATRQRQDKWGHPISPFPKVRRKSPILEEDEDGERTDIPSTEVEHSGSTGISFPQPITPSSEDVFVEGSSTEVHRFASLRKSLTPIRRSSVIRSMSPSTRPQRQSLSPRPSLSPSRQDTSQTLLNDDGTSQSKVPDSGHDSQDIGDLPPSEDEDDLYGEYTVPIHDTSVDSIAVAEAPEEISVQPSEPPQPQAPPPSASTSHTSLRSPAQHVQRRASTTPSPRLSLSPPVESPLNTKQTTPPTEQRHTVSSPSAPLPQQNDRPRSPVAFMDLDDSEDEEEDEVSVVRELSQPPDFGSGDESERRSILTPAFARVHIGSSPNPFRPSLQSPAVRPQVSRVQAAKEKLMASIEKSSPGRSPVELSLADNAGDEDDPGESIVDPNVVKITSDDPLAAARAAAILRLHRYNSIDESTLRKRRHSNPAVDAILRSARKRVTSESGITKTTPRRRHPMGKVVGNQVYIPGSPSMTLPELLDRTEASLHKEELSAHFSPLRNVSFADDFSTPTKQIIPSFDRFKASPARPVGPRAWSKSDWKQLDACYTDERLALGELLGLGADELASADVVELEDVVERFVKILGGDEVLEQFGSQWTRNELLKRARALQRKQRSGNHAAPTPSRQSSVFSIDTNFGRYLSPAPRLPSISSDATACHRGSIDRSSLSPSPSARYDKLIDEAVAVMNGEIADTPTRPPMKVPVDVGSPSIASRMKGFIFSYLPKLSKPKAVPQPSVLEKGLPVPPPEVFNKPRPAVMTPAPKPKERSAHPKDLVSLAPAPKPSMIPRPTKHHRRLVDLNHVTPPAPKVKPKPTVGRRDSGASVKDLVQSFEDISKQDISIERESSSRLSHRRVEDWAGPNIKSMQKAIWKP